MAKNIESILKNLKAWQNENEGRAVSVFLVDNERGCMNLMCGKGLDLIGGMAFYALRDEEIKEMMQTALDTAKMMLEQEKENEE